MNSENTNQKPERMNMYLGVGTSKPSEKNKEYKQGVDHAFLIFVLAPDLDDAKALAVNHLESTAWMDVQIDKMDPVNVEALKQAQPQVMDAYNLALEAGSHAMILEAPKQTH